MAWYNLGQEGGEYDKELLAIALGKGFEGLAEGVRGGIDINDQPPRDTAAIDSVILATPTLNHVSDLRLAAGLRVPAPRGAALVRAALPARGARRGASPAPAVSLRGISCNPRRP